MQKLRTRHGKTILGEFQSSGVLERLGGGRGGNRADAERWRTPRVKRPTATVVSGWSTITLNVNGQDRQVKVEPRTTLLDVLRYQLDLTGAKPVSLDGSSGASTVLVDGKPATASTLLALSVRGKADRDGRESEGRRRSQGVCRARRAAVRLLHAGLRRRRASVLESESQSDPEQILAGLNGNICRCGTYANIIQAAVSIVKGGGNG